MKTWHFEMAFVAVVLATVVLLTGRYSSWIEWVGAGAVLLTFGHAQVADRLAENAEFAASRGICGQMNVECFRWSDRYLIGKELLWMAYFVMHQSWSALVGVGIFIMYPAWRHWWRSE